MGSSSATAVRDVDNNIYTTVTIGSQTWLRENLRTTRFNDSTLITQDTMAWITKSHPLYTWYGNGENDYPDYGALYNWYVVDTSTNGNKNVCPLGWHVPSEAEGFTLAITSGVAPGVEVGGKGKVSGLGHWDSPNTGATNDTGFSGLPGGLRIPPGEFFDVGKRGYWWTTSTLEEEEFETPKYAGLSYDSDVLVIATIEKEAGLSIRCLKD